MFVEWQTPFATKAKRKGGPFDDGGPFLFVHKGKSSPVHVVNDKHALAAHEHWHRKTGGHWVTPPAQREEDPDQLPRAPFGLSGTLLSACREAPAGGMKVDPEVAVPGVVVVTISFKALTHEAIVDFAVAEISHTEYEVHVLEERRNWNKQNLISQKKDARTKKQLQGLEEIVKGTSRGIGRIRTIDLVGGRWAASARQAAHFELGMEEGRQDLLRYRQAEARRLRKYG
eukprot:TRINITY_DN15508_c2_g3_i1.p1 TRINITY_DN15508_c2_g3~~TRINITY_DN15508_c2_g3_i1.p1  ORF type:complete len:229 (-),score=37.08 TRINITY_DN15508_c2_g3_i1:95-781(-)